MIKEGLESKILKILKTRKLLSMVSELKLPRSLMQRISSNLVYMQLPVKKSRSSVFTKFVKNDYNKMSYAINPSQIGCLQLLGPPVVVEDGFQAV